MKVGKEAITPFVFIYLPLGCKALRRGKVVINEGHFPPSWFFQPPPPSFTYLAGGWFLFSARKLQSISMHECSPASIQHSEIALRLIVLNKKTRRKMGSPALEAILCGPKSLWSFKKRWGEEGKKPQTWHPQKTKQAKQPHRHHSSSHRNK